MKAHLLKIPNQGVEICKAISDDILKTIQNENDQAKFKKERQVLESRKNVENASLPPSPDLLQHKKRKGP